MKKFLSVTALLLMVYTHASAWGYDFIYDGFAYNLNDDGSVTLTSDNDFYESFSGPVVVPDEVPYEGQLRPVTAIDESAFYRNANITSLTIGKNVKTIGAHAFYICSSLQGTLNIPEGVTSIGNFAFGDCAQLTGVVIPKSVTSIGEYAFDDCTGLTAVYISDIAAWCRINFTFFWDNPLSYAHHLYLNGQELTDLVIPDEITSISPCAFYQCTSLQNVTIGNGVTTIGFRSFCECSNIRTLTLGRSVSEINEIAFYRCYALNTVYSYPVNPPTLNDSPFADVDFHSVTLHVPKGSKEKYDYEYPWYWCQSIVEDLDTQANGDINNDSMVDVEDVNAAINIILKNKSMSDYPGNGDMDGNGLIDVEDINAIINIILKVE
ncbi:MAG: leucine-rich repeat protein [Muribaculaceae bacterium]|nr:leucine-rich repeat protein [Muribaculaceae bacterium]